jgi:RNase P subunit RPR2
MKEKNLVTNIAKERITILIDAARSIENENPRLAQKYTKTAREIKEHYRIKDRYFKRYVCKGCNSPLIPGKTCKVVIASSKRKIIYKCTACGFETKINY